LLGAAVGGGGEGAAGAEFVPGDSAQRFAADAVHVAAGAFANTARDVEHSSSGSCGGMVALGNSAFCGSSFTRDCAGCAGTQPAPAHKY